MLTKQTVLASMEILRGGLINARLSLEIKDGDNVLHAREHIAGFAPGVDVAGQFAAVNSSLGDLGWGPVAEADMQKVTDAAALWTAEMIAAHKTAPAII